MGEPALECGQKPIEQEVDASPNSNLQHTVEDLRFNKGKSITCLVFGAGLGRLVQYCIDAVTSHGLTEAIIHAVDANAIATECLKNYFDDYVSEGAISVVVHDSFALFPGMQIVDLPYSLKELHRRCDLIVSELLGCFGCDEFLPELTSTLSNLFLKSDGICIPSNWQSYIVPIQSYQLHNSLPSSFPSSTYTVGVPEDCIFMSEPEILWEGSCYDYKTPQCDRDEVKFILSPFMVKESGEVTKIIKRKSLYDSNCTGSLSDSYVIHGLIGYFTSCLYDDIIIETRHNNRRNSFHWECFYMPLKEPISLSLHTSMSDNYVILASIRRICGVRKPSNGVVWFPDMGLGQETSLSLRYSWEVKLCRKLQSSLELLRKDFVKGNAIYLIYS